MDEMLLAIATIVSILSFSLVVVMGLVMGHSFITIIARGALASMATFPLFLLVGFLLLPDNKNGD